jgi:phosphoribosylformylglycinamidine cyclo-ligase
VNLAELTDSSPNKRNTYREAGVDYAALDAGKRLALDTALSTSALIEAAGGVALDRSRGEPAFVFGYGDEKFGVVMEGLGTKSIVAQDYLAETGRDHFNAVAYDAVGAIVNDLICVGALPMVVNAYFASGSGEWYLEEARYASLLEGWRRACVDASCVWGGGESPSLPDLVSADYIELAGCAFGVIPPTVEPILGQHLAPGDDIVLVASSGLHANGASLARHVAARLPEGWRTPVPGAGDCDFGEAILTASTSYVPLMRQLLGEGVPISYISHITGHGLLKLMRPSVEYTYRLRELPPVPPVLSFVAEHSDMDAHSAYSTLNMGTGFAVYCASGSGEDVVSAAQTLGLNAIVGGKVEAGPKRVILEPLGIEFESGELRLAPTS